MKELLKGLTNEDVYNKPDFKPVLPSYEPIKQIADKLGQSVIGQEEACTQLARAVLRASSGLGDPNRPMGVFLFVGPTGVGKTEMSKALAGWMSPGKDWKEHYQRIDCTEFQEPHAISKLIGSPPGYLGYGDPPLLDSKRLKNGMVICFDEVEKAHPNLWKLQMQIMEEGKLTTNKRTTQNQAEIEVLDFSKTIIILTSNAGAQQLHNARTGRDTTIGFRTSDAPGEDIQKVAMNALGKTFQGYPEYLARMDAIVPFNDLKPEHYLKIVDKFMDEINSTGHHHYLALTNETKIYLLEKAVQKDWGARNIRHALDQFIIAPFSEIEYSGVLKGDSPVVAVYDQKLAFYTSDIEPVVPTVIKVTREVKKKEPINPQIVTSKGGGLDNEERTQIDRSREIPKAFEDGASRIIFSLSDILRGQGFDPEKHQIEPTFLITKREGDLPKE